MQSQHYHFFFFNVFNIFSFSFCEFRGKKVKRTLFPCLLLVKVLLLFVSAIYSRLKGLCNNFLLFQT